MRSNGYLYRTTNSVAIAAWVALLLSPTLAHASCQCASAGHDHAGHEHEVTTNDCCVDAATSQSASVHVEKNRTSVPACCAKKLNRETGVTATACNESTQESKVATQATCCQLADSTAGTSGTSTTPCDCHLTCCKDVIALSSDHRVNLQQLLEQHDLLPVALLGDLWPRIVASTPLDSSRDLPATLLSSPARCALLCRWLN